MYIYKTIIFDFDSTLFKADTITKSQLDVEVINMLDDLKNDYYTLCICSNKSSEYVSNILDQFKMKYLFQIVKARVEGLERYQLIKQILDENTSCSAIIVGDTSINFEAAEETSCLSIGVSDEFSVDACNNADFIAHKPEDIYKIIKKINGVYKEIARQIYSRKQNNKPLVVGINGIDSSERTMLIKELENYLIKTGFKVQSIAIDDFNTLEIRNEDKEPIISYINYEPKDVSDVIININDFLKPKIIKNLNCKEKENDKIRLEEVEAEHLHEIIKMLEEDEAREMLGVVTLPSINDYKDKNSIAYVIIDENSKFIGIVELFNISWKNRRGELSITIKSQMRGKGYGFIAINQILKEAFMEFGMNRVWLRVIETNKKAINLYKKVGFVQEGICRGESLRKGQFVNQIQMSILAKEWKKIRYNKES
jgi:RimJ/RimL family protein N-acetyltransferase